VTRYRLAVCRAAAGDPAAYREACDAFLTAADRSAESRDGTLAAWTVGLGPQAPAAVARALRLLESALLRQPEDPSLLQTKALLLYRKGEPQAALALMEKLPRLRGHDGDEMDHRILALVTAGLGRRDEAARRLQRSVQATDTGDLDPSRFDWDTRGELLILRRETERLIGTGRQEPVPSNSLPVGP
jgi:tetratricopeptide (TPR) repeat protein